MNIRVWIAITDNGDGSHNARLYPSEEHLRTDIQLDEYDFSPKLDEYDFSPNWDIPVEIVSRVIDENEYPILKD